MKLLALFIAFSTVTTAKCKSRAVPEGSFCVSGFSADCADGASALGCSINFTVVVNQSSRAIACGTSVPPAVAPGAGAAAVYLLPEIPFTQCADPTVIWSFRAVGVPNQTAYNYSLTLDDPGRGIAAVKLWDSDEFPMVEVEATGPVYQIYSGRASFEVAE